MDKEYLKTKLEELDIEPALLDDVISKISEMPQKKETQKRKESTEAELKIMLNETGDWRERAKIAASIISLNLE